ncbi:MAG: signal transduction histidine kinase [Natronomonas sp.]|jgi:signal transduction histidine kinase|uniref:ATP-binding protein n=1 Tax=Natronomonas sp. TaxID=2184060 RepID=UPI0039893785
MRASLSREYLGILLITLGGAFAAAGLTFWFAWGFPETTAINQVVLGIVVHVLFGYIIVMSGIIIYRSDLDPDESLIAAKWCFGGFLFMSILVVWAAAPEITRSGTTVEIVYEIIVVGSVGAAAGVLVGLNRGQAVQNRRLVEQKAEREDTLVFLLQLLRHDIQNDLTAISGYADLMERTLEDGEAEIDEQPTNIKQRTKSMQELLETAGTVIESETGRRDLEQLDVGAVLRDQLRVIESANPDVTVRTDIDDELSVQADRFIDDLFGNIFENAVTHNETDSLTLSVSATRSDGEVVVEITDNGSGIPESVRENVFEPGMGDGDGDGLGLYLVRKLVESYDGSIRIDDAEPSGTTFEIRFPAV